MAMVIRSEVPNWQISDLCKQLRRIIPVIKANPTEPEKMEGSTDGTLELSPLQGAGYGLYAIWGKPRSLPKEVQMQRYVADAPDNTALYLRAMRFEQQWAKSHPLPKKITCEVEQMNRRRFFGLLGAIAVAPKVLAQLPMAEPEYEMVRVPVRVFLGAVNSVPWMG